MARLGILVRLSFVLAAVLAYAFLAQCRPSVLRAALMVMFVLGARVFGRQYDLVSSISAACLLLLVYDPFFLYDVGFQLSFAAVISIALLAPLFYSKLETDSAKVRLLLAVSIAAQIGVTPMLAYYFNKVSLVSVLANIFVLPVVGLALLVGVLASVFGLVSNWLASPFYILAGFFLSYITGVAYLVAKLPGAVLNFDKPHPLAVFGYYFFAGIGSLALWKNKKLHLNLGAVVLVVLALMTLSFWGQFGCDSAPGEFTVNFFDVGQADATLAQTPDGYNVLIDGGESATYMNQLLREKGVSKIDLLILSHPHHDHVGGLAEVLQNYEVGLVLDSGMAHTSLSYKKFLKTIDEKDISYRIARRGQKYELGQKLKIYILSPPSEVIAGTASALNNNSIVAKLKYDDFFVLTTGDVEREAQSNLLKSGQDIKATVLKVPHHGSADGGDPKFLETAQPQIAVISVGEDNPFGHPALTTLAKLKSVGAKIYRTDTNGGIIVRSNGKTFNVEKEK